MSGPCSFMQILNIKTKFLMLCKILCCYFLGFIIYNIINMNLAQTFGEFKLNFIIAKKTYIYGTVFSMRIAHLPAVSLSFLSVSASFNWAWKSIYAH